MRGTEENASSDENDQGYIRQETTRPDSPVSLDALLSGFHERWISLSPDIFPLNGLAARVASPIFYYASSYFDRDTEGVEMKGSTVRHAALLAQSPQSSPSSYRYTLDRVIRHNPYIMGQLEELPLEIQEPLKRHVYNSPDFDFKLPRQTAISPLPFVSQYVENGFYESIPHALLPLLSTVLITNTYSRRPDLVHHDMERIAYTYRRLRLPPPIAPSRHIHDLLATDTQLQKNLGEHITYAALLDMEAAIPPLSSYDFTRLTPFPHYPDVVILGEDQTVRDGHIRIGRITIAADMRPRRSERLTKAHLHPIMTFEFSNRLSPDEEDLFDARRGKGATSYDNATAQIKKFPLVSLSINQQTRDIFTQPVALGSNWRHRSVPDAYEMATRVLWQAVDTEYNTNHRNTPYVTQESLTDMADYLSVHKRFISTFPPFQRENIQKNLLFLIIASPHRFIEYTGKSGFWDTLVSDTNAPSWEDALHKLEEKIPQEEYITQLKSESSQELQSGWEMLDEILDLKKIYPATRDDQFLVRIYQFLLR